MTRTSAAPMPRRWKRSNAVRPARRCLAQSRLRPLRHLVPGPAYVDNAAATAAPYPHHLYRRPAADRPRHRLPQSGRHLDAADLDASRVIFSDTGCHFSGSRAQPRNMLNGIVNARRAINSADCNADRSGDGGRRTHRTAAALPARALAAGARRC